MRFPQGAEWLIILVVILLLFGAKRLPDAARGLGRSLRILKAETKGLHEDGDGTADQLPNAAGREQLPPADAPGRTDAESGETEPESADTTKPPA